MSEMASRTDIASLPIRYEQQLGVVRFSGPVDANRIFALCDEIDSLINEYYYSRIRIEIDSSGGEAKSLLYFCEKLKEWRRTGARIETKALTLCASAAALMLSMGEIGFRAAMPKTMLLYHNARINLSQRPLTSDVLAKLGSSLCKTDSDMLVSLMRHIYGGVRLECFRLLEAFSCKLPFMERKIDIDAFKILNNTKINQLARRVTKTVDDLDQYRLRTDLHHAVKTLLTTKPAGKGGQKTGEDRQPDPEDNDVITTAWLLRRFEHFQELFTEDNTICPEEALSEGLIDSIAG